MVQREMGWENKEVHLGGNDGGGKSRLESLGVWVGGRAEVIACFAVFFFGLCFFVVIVREAIQVLA